MRRGPRDGGQRSSKFIVAARPPQRQRESYPIQDEPEAGVGFQHKMILKRERPRGLPTRSVRRRRRLRSNGEGLIQAYRFTPRQARGLALRDKSTLSRGAEVTKVQ